MWKSLNAKTNCSDRSTRMTVQKRKTHYGKHHPTPKNKNPTLRNITSPSKNQNPLLPKPTKTIVRLKFAVAGVLAWWLVNRKLKLETQTDIGKWKPILPKTKTHCSLNLQILFVLWISSNGPTNLVCVLNSIQVKE